MDDDELIGQSQEMSESEIEFVQALETAKFSSDVSQLARLLKSRPDFLRFGDDTLSAAIVRSMFSRAVSNGRLSVVQLFVELGMDVNQADDLDDTEGPMWLAARNGHLDVVRYMLENSAKINTTRNGPLTAAARGGHLEIVKMLIERGADLSASWHGVNGLMEAEFYGHPEVADYLRSLGMKDVRETNPPNFASAHKTLLRNMTERAGEPSNWQLVLSGDPLIIIRHIPGEPSCEGYSGQMLFTTGLSDHRLPDGEDPFHCTEVRLHLPPEWPLTPESLSLPQWNWPVEWMKRIASELRAADHMDYPFFFMNGDPPQPLDTTTYLCGWVGMRSDECHRQMPDWRWVSLLDLFPIYPDERQMIQSQGPSAFAQCLEQRGIPIWIDPQRPCLADADPFTDLTPPA